MKLAARVTADVLHSEGVAVVRSTGGSLRDVAPVRG